MSLAQMAYVETGFVEILTRSEFQTLQCLFEYIDFCAGDTMSGHRCQCQRDRFVVSS
jgi:hypothetical protein